MNLLYRLNRRLLAALVRPRPAGTDAEQLLRSCGARAEAAQPNLIYVLENRSQSDLIVLDLVTRALGLPSPFEPLAIGQAHHPRRFFYLNRPVRGRYSASTSAERAQRLAELLDAARAQTNPDTQPEPVSGAIIPVAVFWGRAPSGNGSMLRLLLSEHWAVTSRLKRLVNIVLSRNDILVHFGQPLALADVLQPGQTSKRILSRLNRHLRVRVRNQRVATLGPDLSHQRTLIDRIVQSRAVGRIIDGESIARAPELEARARRYAAGIASNMSHPTIRVLERLLRWFWNRIYEGVEIEGLEKVTAIAEGRTLVYVPSHRSHLDYLLLSYLLYQQGLMIPHIAAGDNLNLPVIGNILRRAGAFFIRRSFRDDELYSAVFAEYLYQVYRQGHSVEFFPEGGRTRTGRLLPARYGLLKTTLEHQARGLPRPLVFIPVYFGYEKLVEAASYLDELRGAEKRRESIGDVMRGLRLIRQNFGTVQVRFGSPLSLDEWLAGIEPDNREPAALAPELGAEIMRRINASAAVNPVNLVALVTLCMPRLSIEEQTLATQIDIYQRLLRADAGHHDFGISASEPLAAIHQVESLGLLDREQTSFGAVLGHSPFAAVMITWYRNNVTHVLAVPSLIACLLRNRRRPIAGDSLIRMGAIVLPYIEEELSASMNTEDIGRWLSRLEEAGLVKHEPAGYLAPDAQSPQHYQLRLLARVIMPVLERLYIVVGTMFSPDDGTPALTRASLQSRSIHVAAKMSRLYGLNAPEFFDARLFNQSVDTLLREGLLIEEDNGSLRHSAVIADVLRAAETVIDPDFRLAVLQERGEAAGA